MARGQLAVRTGTGADLGQVGDLVAQMLEETGTRWLRGPGARATSLPEVLAAALEDPTQRLLVADQDGQIVGTALLLTGLAGMALEAPVVLVRLLAVRAGHRRRGVGRALLAATARWADECGLDAVAVSAPPGSRELNRYYARLGFAPVAVRRVAPVALLRRRLGEGAAAPAVAGRGGRRLTRRRATRGLHPQVDRAPGPVS